jgi:hypothetical protein
MTQSGHAAVLCFEDWINHLPDSIACCCKLIAVAVTQIDGDPIVSHRPVDPALEITVAHLEKIIALQHAGRRYPIAHKNAEDLTAYVLVGRSFRHRSTIGFARHRSYGRTATVDKIAQPMGNLAFCRGAGAGRLGRKDCSKGGRAALTTLLKPADLPVQTPTSMSGFDELMAWM